jgi:hypothetical protein
VNRPIERSAFPLETHTVPKAESFGLLRALQLVRWPVLHCDCQYAVDVMQSLVNEEPIDWARIDNNDIWWRVKQELEIPDRPKPRVKKVAAHTHEEEADTEWKRWARFHNGCADDEAKNSLKEDHSDLMEERTGIVEQYERHGEQVKLYNDLLVDTNLWFIQHEERAGKRKGLLKEDPNRIANEGLSFVVCKLVMTNEQMNDFVHGKEFAGRLVRWWNSLVWSEEETVGYEGVTCIQLVVDFMIHSGTRPPVDLNPARRRKRPGGHDWRLADVCQRARMQAVTTVGEMRTFRQAMEAILGACESRLTFHTHFLVSGLGDFGVFKAFAGIRRRVILTEQAEVGDVLAKYFHVRNGGSRPT